MPSLRREPSKRGLWLVFGLLPLAAVISVLGRETIGYALFGASVASLFAGFALTGKGGS
jgi:hypothetical protein